MAENKIENESEKEKEKRKMHRTIRVSMDTYQKLSMIMGVEMRKRKKYIPYDTVVDMICDLYLESSLEKSSLQKKEKVKRHE